MPRVTNPAGAAEATASRRRYQNVHLATIATIEDVRFSEIPLRAAEARICDALGANPFLKANLSDAQRAELTLWILAPANRPKSVRSLIQEALLQSRQPKAETVAAIENVRFSAIHYLAVESKIYDALGADPYLKAKLSDIQRAELTTAILTSANSRKSVPQIIGEYLATK
jgi:hypothetical protein